MAPLSGLGSIDGTEKDKYYELEDELGDGNTKLMFHYNKLDSATGKYER